jgi:hypothetical protein
MSEHHSQCDIECSIGIGMFYVFAIQTLKFLFRPIPNLAAPGTGLARICRIDEFNRHATYPRRVAVKKVRRVTALRPLQGRGWSE